MQFEEIVHARHACKHFATTEVPRAVIDEILELILLAPSSFNLQPWKAILVNDEGLKKELEPASWNQPQIMSCAQLLVFCANTDLDALADKLELGIAEIGTPADKVAAFMGMIRQFLEPMETAQRLAWAQRQTYIALSHGMLAASSKGLDSCPMEGFSPDDYARILDLPPSLVPTVLLTIGHGDAKRYPVYRFAKEDLFISS